MNEGGVSGQSTELVWILDFKQILLFIIMGGQNLFLSGV